MKKKTIISTPYFKEYKNKNNLTYQDLSDITGYSTTTMSKFSNGKPVSRGVADVLARELELDRDLISKVVYKEEKR